ncbi:DUF393 domain-containing protein [Aliiglaciecola sp. CAU 1673]|uniref:thiol-disulfide oxidoreductase DCC family protein n=1 Tax=Aliiglaciecola sp. CAU 1673 TaxID=3032595 RepID=UPI0023DCD8BF|nr:DUF393 domain-containing protein [Aliiglaciecola sp. CAU 1673]MDF2180140.1 DUF393 domain-containing protein [Aliiglaciecola sp. CAU 1673]
MNSSSQRPFLRVFYDAACPRCRRDRAWYEQRVDEGENILWVDINGREQELKALGIDPKRALLELHVEEQQGQVRHGISAYQLLFSRLPRYRWLAWVIGLPLIKPLLSYLYRWWVRRRLQRQGRLPTDPL